MCAAVMPDLQSQHKTRQINLQQLNADARHDVISIYCPLKNVIVMTTPRCLAAHE